MFQNNVLVKFAQVRHQTNTFCTFRIPSNEGIDFFSRVVESERSARRGRECQSAA